MKKYLYVASVFTFLLSSSAVVYAEVSDPNLEIQSLKKAFEKLQAEYGAEIQSLRAQVKSLKEHQEETVIRAVDERVGEAVEKKLSGVDYVGRYEGPFQKGGLIYRNPSGFGNVSVGGYVDHEFENFENTNSTFDQHRWIINIGAELANRLRFYSEYEIEHGGTDAAGGGEAHVEQAWMDYLIKDWINFRAGALLVPFGRYNLYHDSDLQDLTDRPLLSRDVIPTTWTESGAGFYGEFYPKIGTFEDLKVAYETYVMNGLNSGFSDTGLGGARGSIESDNNNSKSWVGRVVVSPAIGHELAVSGYTGKFNQSNDLINGIGLDFLSTWGPLELLGEYAFFDIDSPAAGTALPERATGFYLQGNYHFWPHVLDQTFLGSGFDNPTFTFVTRLGLVEIEDDNDLTTGDNSEGRLTFGLNYRPVESWVLKLEYQINSNHNENLERGGNDGFIASVAMGF